MARDSAIGTGTPRCRGTSTVCGRHADRRPVDFQRGVDHAQRTTHSHARMARRVCGVRLDPTVLLHPMEDRESVVTGVDCLSHSPLHWYGLLDGPDGLHCTGMQPQQSLVSFR